MSDPFTAEQSHPHRALARLVAVVQPVGNEVIDRSEAGGRVLGEPLRSDRDSPACDASAMDGFAVRRSECGGWLPIAGEVAAGSAPPALPLGHAMRISTGAGIPAGADAVVRSEQAKVSRDNVLISADRRPEWGANIRVRGENAPAGTVVVGAGRTLDPVAAGAASSFGASVLRVHRRVRVGVVVTGDEVRAGGSAVEPWQLRDVNGAALWSLFEAPAWLDQGGVRRSGDTFDETVQALGGALAESDAVVLTGGVSVGAHDHVPRAVQECGGRILFHGLRIRPGHPVLGAVGPEGQPILGLPGNPVAVLVTARRFAVAALRKRAGMTTSSPPLPVVQLKEAKPNQTACWHYRLVRLVGDGVVLPVAGRGSGDVVALARSDGFVEVSPSSDGGGPLPYYSWTV